MLPLPARAAEVLEAVGVPAEVGPLMQAARIAEDVLEVRVDLILRQISSTVPGSAITNGREPGSCLGRVFNFKLGSFVSKKYNSKARTQPLLKLKTQPRFCPVSSSLSMTLRNLSTATMHKLADRNETWAKC